MVENSTDRTPDRNFLRRQRHIDFAAECLRLAPRSSFALPTAESGFSVRVPQLQPELDAPTLRLRDGGSPRWHGCPSLAANPWLRLEPPHEKAAQPVFGPASNSPHYRRAAALGQQT